MASLSSDPWPALERGTGTPVVMLHGYPLDHTMWLPQLRELSEDHRIALLDLPGYGLAEGWVVPDTLAGFSEWVHRALSARFRGPVTVVGHSFGGYVALQLYRDHPEDFAGLVLTNTRPSADTDADRTKRLATIERLGHPSERLDPEAVGRGLVAPATWTTNPRVVEEVRGMIGRAPTASVIATLKAIAGRPDLTPVLPTISVPTRVIWGDEDALIPPDQTRAMVALIPRSEGFGIPHAGHLPSLESPGTFNDAIRGLPLPDR